MHIIPCRSRKCLANHPSLENPIFQPPNWRRQRRWYGYGYKSGAGYMYPTLLVQRSFNSPQLAKKPIQAVKKSQRKFRFSKFAFLPLSFAFAWYWGWEGMTWSLVIITLVEIYTVDRIMNLCPYRTYLMASCTQCVRRTLEAGESDIGFPQCNRGSFIICRA